MKRYGVRLYFDTYYYQEVMAESEEDALNKAKDKVYKDEINYSVLAENACLDNLDADVWEVK